MTVKGQMNNQKIYIGHIPASYDANTVEQLFSAYGKITEVIYPTDKKTKQPKGYAFVTFANPGSAERALEKNDEELQDQKLIVEIAIEKTTKKKVEDTIDEDKQ